MWCYVLHDEGMPALKTFPWLILLVHNGTSALSLSHTLGCREWWQTPLGDLLPGSGASLTCLASSKRKCCISARWGARVFFSNLHLLLLIALATLTSERISKPGIIFHTNRQEFRRPSWVVWSALPLQKSYHGRFTCFFRLQIWEEFSFCLKNFYFGVSKAGEGQILVAKEYQ